MLVLSRKRNEAIDLFDQVSGLQVEVEVLDIRGDKVRLGLSAPDEVVINRREVTLAIARQEQERYAEEVSCGRGD